MKKVYFFTTILAFIFLLDSNTVMSQLPQIPKIGGDLTENEAAQGIKEALGNGVADAVLQLNKTDGFFKSAIYKVLLPPDAQKIEKTLRSMGMGSMVDKAILQINRGAEEAAGYAKPIFVNAIKNMTLSDAIGLVKNGDTSGTHFFRVKTTDSLRAAFLPVIKKSLDNTDATKYYSDMVNTYNKLPMTFKKANPDLNGYVTEKAMEALFNLIGKEEINIRNNAAARTTDVLQKVFGGLIH